MLKLFKRKESTSTIIERSNVIQYDEMGYPLRLCIFSDGYQRWVDTYEEDTDIVLKQYKVYEKIDSESIREGTI